MKLQIGYLTHGGTKHAVNQDCLGISQGVPPALLAQKGHLFAVADGFGEGEVGSAVSGQAVYALTRAYYANQERDTGTALVQAVEQANLAVTKATADAGAAHKAGATLTAAVVRGNTLHVAHAGDSRAYLLSGGGLRQLTHDHTWGAEQVRSGKLTPEQVSKDPKRGHLSRALGIQSDFKRESIEHVAETLRPGDTLLLCTDGLTDRARESEWVSRLRGREPSAVAQQLVALAGERGGHDDVTAVVVKIGSKGIPVSVWAPFAAVGGALVLTLLVVLLASPATPPAAPGPGETSVWTPGDATAPALAPPGDATPGPETPVGGPAATSTLAPTRPAIAPVPSRTPGSASGAGVGTAPAVPVAYGAPQLVAPVENAEYRGPDAEIRLQWTSVGTLGPDDYYVVMTDFPHDGTTWRDWQQTKATELLVPRYLYDQITGAPRRCEWRVTVWRDPKIVNSQMIGTPVSPESGARAYVWDEVGGPSLAPTGTPSYSG